MRAEEWLICIAVVLIGLCAMIAFARKMNKPERDFKDALICLKGSEAVHFTKKGKEFTVQLKKLYSDYHCEVFEIRINDTVVGTSYTLERDWKKYRYYHIDFDFDAEEVKSLVVMAWNAHSQELWQSKEKKSFFD